MPSTYSSNLKIELMSTGENSGTWGNITNTNLGTALEQAIVGYGAVSYLSDANLTISITNTNAAQAARALVLNVTSALSLTATRELVVPTIEKQYIVQNNTTGSQSITVKTSAGTGITVPNGRKAHLYVDGTNVIQMFDFVDINGGTIDGTPIGGSSAAAGAFTSLTASGATTLNGAVALGDAAADLITVPGTINSNLLFTDNSFDIGASGANRPRNLFLAGAATVGGNLSVGGTLTLTGGLILNGNVTVGDSSADTLTVNATITSNLIFTDNTYDIGASGATRPRNLFLAGNATIGGNATVGSNVIVDGTTDATSTITGSLQTDGGLGVAKAAYIGTTLNIGGLTSGRVAYVTTAGRFTDSANLLYSGTDLTVYGITVGRGAGAIATNTAVGATALGSNTTGFLNTAFGNSALNANTTGNSNTAVGVNALVANTTGYANISIGRNSLVANTTGYQNIAIGSQDEISVYGALRSNTTGVANNAIGNGSLQANTTGSYNTAVGHSSLTSNTTASNNTAVGYQAGYSNTTGVELTALGFQSLYNSTGNYNTGVGYRSLFSNTTGSENTALGDSAAQNTTTGFNNTAIGSIALVANTTGADNTSVGKSSMRFNTTGAYNTAVGSNALQTNTTASYNTAVGYFAGYAGTTATQNTLIGYYAGANLTTGSFNCFIGGAAGNGSGGLMTTGSKNTILGSFSGNQGGLDIRTSSNNTVLSDGDGTPQFVINGNSQSGLFGIPFSGWDSTRYRSLQFGNGTSARYFSITQQFTAACAGSLLWNAYGDGDNAFKYAVTGDRAAMIQISSDAVNIYGAPTGTAGNAVAWETLLGLQRNFSVALQGASGQSGTGITFPATQNASSNANTLDDYEEGEWTPTGLSNCTVTANISTRYTKIGRLVTAYSYMNITTTSSSFSISGLPFASNGYAAVTVGYTAGQATVRSDNYTESGAAYMNLSLSNNLTNTGFMVNVTYFV